MPSCLFLPVSPVCARGGADVFTEILHPAWDTQKCDRLWETLVKQTQTGKYDRGKLS